VGDKYQLSKEERLILYRGFFGDSTIEKHKRKLLSPSEIRGERIAIDGYNVLITVESMLSDRPLLLCKDGVIRDISGIYGKHKFTKTTRKAIELILAFLKRYKPSEVCFFFDAQVSKSGELAALIRKSLKEAGIIGDAKAVKQADSEALRYSDIVATSDSVSIDYARKVIDIAGEIVGKIAPKSLINLTKLVKKGTFL
jgi:hypothetical protein